MSETGVQVTKENPLQYVSDQLNQLRSKGVGHILQRSLFGHLHSRFAHDQTNLPYRRLLMLA